MVSKATVHPAAANDDDVVVTRPAASLAQGNSAESAEMKAKIVSFFSSLSLLLLFLPSFLFHHALFRRAVSRRVRGWHRSVRHQRYRWQWLLDVCC